MAHREMNGSRIPGHRSPITVGLLCDKPAPDLEGLGLGGCVYPGNVYAKPLHYDMKAQPDRESVGMRPLSSKAGGRDAPSVVDCALNSLR
jgi:hypothetical protein